ncbi:TPA: DUF551 domain-containing protein [Salmonella enterica subsp. enterica serovar Mississippi]|uniref:DUF551 domain-containing protein n=1 Tax=Salmonella enterica TaxID=28901 RepID=UPI001EE83A9F|nr:DUF551 domain-containing protein [Salmonella enterica]ULA44525.1 DUF551 domain-containing protein [Salmonella enterica]UNN13726.1 DUF551 domain-containing protein [Salmonella enterica]UNN18051.1 DUF551 domain-containing protein [Salmonella enterica]UNN22365.1 DUF551 domain-containing protein [Salmonella enterica]
MTTITKEWLQQTIAEFENTRDDIPFGLDDDDAKILKVLKQALALLDAEPVSQTYKLPQTQFEQVADLYEMQFDDGRTCAFHTDGAKAAQWLLTCDGNKVQEYVRLERYQEAVIGNSPVIPDGYALVPVEPTPEMREAFHVANEEYKSGTYDGWSPNHQWQAMLTAAPQQEAIN